MCSPEKKKTSKNDCKHLTLTVITKLIIQSQKIIVYSKIQKMVHIIMVKINVLVHNILQA